MRDAASACRLRVKRICRPNSPIVEKGKPARVARTDAAECVQGHRNYLQYRTEPFDSVTRGPTSTKPITSRALRRRITGPPLPGSRWLSLEGERTMNLRRLAYNEQGDLKSGLLYELRTSTSVSLDKELYSLSESWIHPEANAPDSHSYVYHSEVICDVRRQFNCAEGEKHRTGHEYNNFRVDLFGGDKVADFIPNRIHLIATSSFGKELIDSGLTGVSSIPVEVGVNQSSAGDIKISLLAVSGRWCIRRYEIPGSTKNECPFCGHGPVLCATCGYITRVCEVCENQIVVPAHKHEGVTDRRWAQDRIPERGPIMDGRTWDGHDFCDGWGAAVVTKRTIDWLLKSGAFGWYAIPLRVDLTGMTKDRIRFLRSGL